MGALNFPKPTSTITSHRLPDRRKEHLDIGTPELGSVVWLSRGRLRHSADRLYRLEGRFDIRVLGGLHAGAYLMISRTPVEYQAELCFVLFSISSCHIRRPGSCWELHRPPAELQYNHTYAYSPGTPLANRQYRAEFSHEVTTRKILAFYVRHPGIGFEILSSDFHLYAPDIPVGNFGTMRRADNQGPVFRANGLRI